MLRKKMRRRMMGMKRPTIITKKKNKMKITVIQTL